MIVSIWYVVVAVQLIITVVLSFQFLRYTKVKLPKQASISIIIAARNELENLKKLIPHLLAQSHPNFELIIALDRCTDESADFLDTFNDPRLKYVQIEETPSGLDSKKYALNAAINRSNNDWLVFTDADCLPNSEDWLNSIQKRIGEKTKIIVGYSPYQRKQTLLSQYISFENFIIGFNYLSMTLLNHPYMAVGRNMAIEKAFFVKTGGYVAIQSVIGGDDDLFIQKNADNKNTQVLMGVNSLVKTFPKKTWKEYFAQKTRHLSVSTHYSATDKWFHLLNNGTILLFWSIIPFISFEIILPIILFYLSVKVISYRFAHSKIGAGFNYMLFPLVDIMYAILLPIIAIRSKLVKDIKWKN